jgi:drug/metabolite transporter (DMT)-like permease
MSMVTSSATPATTVNRRLRQLQALGVVSGIAAGAWLGAAEAPTKLVTLGLSPVVVSLAMVAGVFLARWTLPAVLQGTSQVGADFRRSPHLLVWALLAGCLWAVANTLTVFAIRDVGLSIAFPLWNSNSLLGIFWGFLLFNELRHAGALRWTGVIGGAVLMFGGGALLAVASATQAPAGHPWRGVVAALTAGALWGTMYIPYRKAYLTGMNPLSFVTFFTVGEVLMMSALALIFTGGAAQLWAALVSARPVLFWLFLGGFVWVIGDLFQQYAAKYIGISRGIPLSNTNQLWGLLWGVLVFGELRHESRAVLARVVAGSVLMAAGAAAIALSSATESEHARWQDAAARESRKYRLDADQVRAGMYGHATGVAARRTWIDWLLAGIAAAIFAGLGVIAAPPQLVLDWRWFIVLACALVVFLVAGGALLRRVTQFR